MMKSGLPGGLFILGGILLAFLPQSILPVCSSMVPTASGGIIPMKCFWTARAELGVGVLIAFGGLLYCLCRDAGARFGIAAMTAGTALLATALPTLLIGVCASSAMQCRVGTLPGLLLLGSAIFIVALFACFFSRRAMRQGKGS